MRKWTVWKVIRSIPVRSTPTFPIWPCAKKLLAVPNLIYPQFATHNAHTLAAIYQLAGQNYYPGQYEFQCLHGMGEPLYEQVTGKVADG